MESPQNVGSQDPGSQIGKEGFTKKLRSLLQVPGKKILNSYYVLYLQEFSIAFYFQTIMYYAYRIFICFLLPNLSICRDISNIHLIDFVV